MKHSPYTTADQSESVASGKSRLTATRWRVLTLPVILGLTLIIMLMTGLLPTYSDDGPGVEENAFDSPLVIWKYPSGDETLLNSTASTPGDLLTNGDMDQMGFYWRYPNHWIAGGWFEWFATTVGGIPEFDDGHRRGFAHTLPSSQRLQLWGVTYAAGLLQSPSVQPCTFYRFQAYGQGRPGSDNPPPVDVASHMKLGIEPNGWLSGRTIPKYNPGIEPDDFPATVVWSPESNQPFVWTPYSVTAEALSSTVTVILYSNPQVDYDGGVIWHDAIWDTASLVEVPSPSGTLLEGDHLPGVDGFIRNLSVNALPELVIVEWDTPVEASSQVLYRLVDASTPITPTETLTHTVYVPFVLKSTASPDNMQSSPVYATPVRHHQVVLTGLPDEYTIEVAALSRRLEDADCVTSASEIASTASAGEPWLSLYLPALQRGE